MSAKTDASGAKPSSKKSDIPDGNRNFDSSILNLAKFAYGTTWEALIGHAHATPDDPHHLIWLVQLLGFAQDEKDPATKKKYKSWFDRYKLEFWYRYHTNPEILDILMNQFPGKFHSGEPIWEDENNTVKPPKVAKKGKDPKTTGLKASKSPGGKGALSSPIVTRSKSAKRSRSVTRSKSRDDSPIIMKKAAKKKSRSPSIDMSSPERGRKRARLAKKLAAKKKRKLADEEAKRAKESAAARRKKQKEAFEKRRKDREARRKAEQKAEQKQLFQSTVDWVLEGDNIDKLEEQQI